MWSTRYLPETVLIQILAHISADVCQISARAYITYLICQYLPDVCQMSARCLQDLINSPISARCLPDAYQSSIITYPCQMSTRCLQELKYQSRMSARCLPDAWQSSIIIIIYHCFIQPVWVLVLALTAVLLVLQPESPTAP